MVKMEGLSFSSLRKHPMLVPLYFCIAAGACGAAAYLLRIATRSPEVTWTHKSNPEPWNYYKDKEYKLLSPSEESLFGRAKPAK